ncbi:MAG: DUF3048 domain-containing protein [Lachnospiraceae bacterium]|nr:DUF3048 domain-containing protein [Lachnospiraceae bacterium]MBQ7782201.1 DUF3048 domain-containing protein [Lachnospiraceae bacterium]
MKKHSLLLLLSLSAMLALGGCGGSEDADAPVRPSDLAQPNDTTVATQDATPTPEATTPVTEEEPEDIPPEEGLVHSPLTNEWIDEELAAQRPIAVMFPIDRAAQPQYGIGEAGVLYECLEEGSMSRQMGIIQDWHDMETIGNIRSGRDYYGYWCMEWDAIFVHWGGPYYLCEVTGRDDFDYLSAVAVGAGSAIETPAAGAGAFFRWGDNSAPHNGYTSGAKLLSAINSLEYDVEHTSALYESNHFDFVPMGEINTLEDAEGAFTATEIDLTGIFPVTKSSFEYDEATGTYLKYMYGSPQIDAATGEQLAFTNVIIQDTAWEYREDNKYLKFQTNDSGRMGWYFTQGRGIQITWTKEDDFSPTRYYDMDGNEIEINAGHTYIGVAQEGCEPVYN